MNRMFPTMRTVYSAKKTFTAAVLFAILTISGCTTSLNPNIQQGNATGQLKDNKWDYYNGTPVHYTSQTRGLYKNAVTIRQEPTDAFSAVVNVDKGRDIASVDFNGKAVVLKKFVDDGIVDSLIEKTFGKSADKKKYKNWDAWYKTEDNKVFLAVSYARQFIVTSYENGDELQQILYYPSRFLACRKIVQIRNEADKAMVRSMLKTALVAGIQSYTSYATTRYSDSYGNFGYARTRDYSWAGNRGADALDALFAGDGSSDSIQKAWNSLNCY